MCYANQAWGEAPGSFIEYRQPECAIQSKELVVDYMSKIAEMIRLLDEGNKDEAKALAEEVVQLRREVQLSLLEIKTGFGSG